MATDSSSSSGLVHSVTSMVDNRIALYLIVGGIALFLIPEPITSVLGVIVLGLGLLAFAVGQVL